MSIRFEDNTEAAISKIRNGIADGVDAGAVVLEKGIIGRMSGGFGIDTGALRDSISAYPGTWKGDTYTAGVKDGKIYGAYVEFGGDGRRVFPPRSMFKNGGDDSKYKVQNEIKKKL